MKKLEVYDPAMCCSTGVCGTDVDPKLVQFASDLGWLKEQGASVERFNLAQQPAAFAANSTVRGILAAEGNDCLPIVLVDGSVATKGIYPTREQLALLAGAKLSVSTCCGGEKSAEEKSEQKSCCCSDDSSSSSSKGDSCCS